MLKIKDGFKGEWSIVIPRMIVEFLQQDIFCHVLYMTDIGFYPHAKNHHRQREQPIEEYVLIYCVDGSGWYSIGKNKYQVAKNQLFILPAGQPHAYGTDDKNPWSIYWLHFAGEMAPGYAQGLDIPKDIPPSSDSRIADRISLFEEMFFTLKAGYNKENLQYAHSILHHFFGTLRYLNLYRQGATYQKGEPLSQGDICQKAIHYMKEHMEGHITLQELADYTGYTPNHFSTMFRKAIGHAPLTYYNLLKMEAATQMLDNTQLKVNQIAARLGYDDSGYFSRLFTKIMGLSPKEYRESTRG